MPPRRLTRSTATTKPTSASTTLDLTRSSPTPSSSDLEIHTAPSSRKGKRRASSPGLEVRDGRAKRVRSSKGKGKEETSGADAREGGLKADEQLARKLQDEEDQAALVAGEQAGPSTSPSASTSARRKSPRKPSTSSSSGPLAPPADPNDPQVVLGSKKALFVGGGTCGKCGAEVPYESEVPSLTPSSTLASFLALTTATCPSCAARLCRGCWGVCEGAGGDDGDGEERKEGECCADGRAVGVFELLSALDAVYLTDHLRRPLPSASTSSASKRKKTAIATGKGKGVGYGSNRIAPGYAGATGVGYAVEEEEDSEEAEEWWDEEVGEYVVRERVKPALTTNKPRENAHDLAQDRLYLLAFRLLSSLLPSPDSPTPKIYDFLPSSLLSPLIELSTLPDLLTLLLRNDSVPEWQRRSEVYFAMLDVLGKIGGSQGLLGVLFGERREKRWSEGIGGWMRGVGEVRWERKALPGQTEEGGAKGKKGKGKAAPRGRKRKAGEGEEEEENKGEIVMTAPLYTHLGKLLRQASAFRKAAISGDFDDSDAALIGICGDFVTAGERFRQTEKVWEDMHGRDLGGAVVEGSGEGKGKGKEREWTEADYVKACEALAYDSVNLAIVNDKGEITYPNHYYNRDILASANSRRTNFAHLAKELAVLSTSLPPGIWVRVDETRVDVIKCLIAGPEHSPYANGLFEFDIFLPLQYPLVSPVCWLKTTGGNKVRFNPNLYAEGKVCLSLLGTWSGAPEEMWQPGQSTILQVLLSISTNYPFYNEPGMGAMKDDERNKNYNKNCSLATTRWAILDWIKDGKFKESIWSDIIVSHFLLQRSKVVSTIKAWAAKDPRMRAWKPGFDSCAGATHLQPYNGGMAYKWAQYNANSQKQPEQKKPAPPPEPAPRDLVQETEDALETLAGWKESGWLDELVA
ncbi:baculoviral IAP repeat-containing protein 6 (apollon) [Rhodotorula toruloides NP11]|uniref:Baculoviral IAP repeat-containing protein 6 (Apollon) n=1 Tax=Rhodotorula toruloides (strain NP11) TaxID=1130832 RepID=M7WJB6_RHOT1|nr:baculoviral IAP repeat-containing protein 6 (apollon) [Rhodotorula toruloides NP11]EMS18111.1 baculoviral IAP repeat-containing protein 6 (apollon) [Rhodotorula toruloides NP11]